MSVVADPDCICRGTGIVTRLADPGPGTTGPELCTCLHDASAPSSVREGGDAFAQDVIDAIRVGLAANKGKTLALIPELLALAPETDQAREIDTLLNLLKAAENGATDATL